MGLTGPDIGFGRVAVAAAILGLISCNSAGSKTNSDCRGDDCADAGADAAVDDKLGSGDVDASDTMVSGKEDSGVGSNSEDSGAGATDAGFEPECDEGDARCDGTASVARSECIGGKWQAADPCDSGSLCDPDAETAGDCQPIAEGCEGRAPGDSYCDGTTRIECGPKLFTTDSNECDSVQHCTLGSGSECASCLSNEYRCDTTDLTDGGSGQALMVCNAEHTDFELVKVCPSGDPCNAVAGECTSLACTPDQLRCNGDDLERCNSEGTGFDLEESCQAGLCDSEAFECDVCPAGVSDCLDGDTARVCSVDGQAEKTGDCVGDTPYCIGAGKCVECIGPKDCDPVECNKVGCNTGTGDCEYSPADRGTACGKGMYCDDAGGCTLECLKATQCPAIDKLCWVAACDGEGQCGAAPEARGVKCGEGEVCDGKGSCVAHVQCQTYCQGKAGVMNVCAGNAATEKLLGTTESSCLDACIAQTSWDLKCRLTHLEYAVGAPDTHCDHALGVSLCD